MGETTCYRPYVGVGAVSGANQRGSIDPNTPTYDGPVPPNRISGGAKYRLSEDQTQLLAAYEGETKLRVLYEFPAPSARAQVKRWPAGFPIISRDGVWVTVVENEERVTSGIARIPLVGPNEPTSILNWPGSQLEASISQDGRRVAFLATEDRCTGYEERGEDFACPKHVYVMDSNGGNVKRLTDETADYCSLAWSPNNAQVAYRKVCDPPSVDSSQVCVVTLEPYNNPKQVTQIMASGLIGPWSPDGEWLEWFSEPFRSPHLSRLDSSGQVIDEIILDQSGIWSPDSKQLATLTWDDAIIVVDIESGETMTNPLQAQDISLGSPMKWLDDNRLIFQGYNEKTRENHWYMVNIDGTDLVEFEFP